MTDQEIEKLREKLGSDYSVKRQNGAITVELVDIWEGVEFAECVTGVKVDRYGKEIIKGNIYPIYEWFERDVIYIDNDELGWQSKHFKPSTEADYVDQLKAKAKELYGDIKDGDRFDRSEMGFEDNHRIGEVRLSVHGWDYYKSDDKLYFGTICIYQQGKWAKKVEEPISDRVYVKPINCSIPTPDYRINAFDQSFEPQEMSFLFSVQGIVVGIEHTKEIANHLSESLQSYLNKIP